MKEPTREIFIVTAAAVFGSMMYLAGYWKGRERATAPSAEVAVRVERQTRTDTVWIDRPVVVSTEAAGTARARLAVAAPQERILTVRDTVEVEVPLTLTEYKDSTYRAWVSGYMATLDSIEVYRRTEQVTIYETRTIRERRKWGFTLGPTVGAGYDGHKVSPYVGVGLTWGFSF